MEILAYAHKNNKILKIVSTSILFISAVVLFIALLFTKGDDKIPCIVLFAICFLGFIWLSVICINQFFTKNEVIHYDYNNKIIILNQYKRIIQIKINEIKEIKYNNKGLTSIGAFIFLTEFEYGKLVIILNDGNKIKTPTINKVKEVYADLNEILCLQQ